MGKIYKDVDWRELQDQSIQEKFTSKKIKPVTPNQSVYLDAIKKSIVTLCIGNPGTGKSYIPCGYAAECLQNGRIKKVIITRPLVTCGKGFGFLPGVLDEKVSPYMRPLLDSFSDFFPANELAKLIKDKVIEMIPLELMRGMSIKNSMIICDEAQNAEFIQLHMLLTRIDKSSFVVINGDLWQSDLAGRGALELVIQRFKKDCHPEISIVQLTEEDICRPQIIRWIDNRLREEQKHENLIELGVWRHIKCLICNKINWFNNGDESDLSQNDIEAVKCFGCGKINEMNEDFIPFQLTNNIKLITKNGKTKPE